MVALESPTEGSPVLMEGLCYGAMETASSIKEQVYDLDVLEHPEVDLKVLAQWLLWLEDACRFLYAAKVLVAEETANRMPGREGGYGRVWLEKGPHTGTDQWDRDELLDHLASRSRDERMVDEETGEFESELSAFLRVLKDCATITTFKTGLKKQPTTGLRAHGIDPEEFRSKASGPRRAKATPHSPPVVESVEIPYDG